jgi:staphylococcal nuclease domain-containing protein 1
VALPLVSPLVLCWCATAAINTPCRAAVLCCGVAGIVEAVLNGSTLRLTLLPERTPVTVTLAGVQCPSMGKRPPPAAAAAPAPEANGAAAEANGTAANGNGAAPAAVTAASIAAAGVTAAAPGGAEPFAREAKWFSESRVLNREVRIPWQGLVRALGWHA